VDSCKILAIIPARGGSKGIPRKNLFPLLGKPLIQYTIEQALYSNLVNRVVVSTDDERVEMVARQLNAEVIKRPPELASDTASTESALIHALDYLDEKEHYVPDYVVLLQCTSPIREKQDIDNAINRIFQTNADSLLSVVPCYRFLWKENQNDGTAASINYDYSRRPRRQDMENQLMENGSIYVTKNWVLRKLKNRLGGKIVTYKMDFWSSFEIDNINDLYLCEWVIQRMMTEMRVNALPEEISLVAFDFDGVFTDNRVIVHSDGSEAVVCNRSDGLGLELLKTLGIECIILSKEKNPVTEARAKKLNMECHCGIEDKEELLNRLMEKKRIKSTNVIFVGNDINDIPVMKTVGCSVAVQDAYLDVKKAAHLILEHKGGDGAVRELCDLIRKKYTRREDGQ